MAGYTVRIGDGSEIDLAGLEEVKTWMAQGLLDLESPVRRPGSRKFVPLGTLPEFKGRARSRKKSRDRKGRQAKAGEPQDDVAPAEPGAVDHWRIRATGLLLLGVAAGIGFVAWRPDVVRPAFDGAPWLELALAMLALAMLVLPGWTLGRRLVRLALLLGAFALFPLTGILIAQGERGVALLALASAWILLSGLVGLLSPAMGWVGLVLALLPVAAGAWGAVHFGRAPESEAVRTAREWSTPDRSFNDSSVGLTLTLPEGWVVLKPGNPLVAAPDTALVTVAQPRLGGFGYLTSEPAPRGVATPDQYLDLLMVGRRAARPGLVEQGRATAILGSQTGRRLDATWSEGETPQSDMTVAALDGWMSFALVAWMPEATASRPGGLEDLAGGLGVRGLLAPRLEAALVAATEAVPHLNRPAAEQLMAQSEARVLEPDQAFRRSVIAIAALLPSLSRAETRELSGLTRATYASVPWKNRRRLADYIERLQRGETTDPAVDREMADLLKGAELALAPDRRYRLQEYYERAIRQVLLAAPPAPAS